MPLYRYIKHAVSVSDTSKQEFFARDFTGFQIKTETYRMIFIQTHLYEQSLKFCKHPPHSKRREH